MVGYQYSNFVPLQEICRMLRSSGKLYSSIYNLADKASWDTVFLHKMQKQLLLRVLILNQECSVDSTPPN